MILVILCQDCCKSCVYASDFLQFFLIEQYRYIELDYKASIDNCKAMHDYHVLHLPVFQVRALVHKVRRDHHAVQDYMEYKDLLEYHLFQEALVNKGGRDHLALQDYIVYMLVHLYHPYMWALDFHLFQEVQFLFHLVHLEDQHLLYLLFLLYLL